jgi:tetratricopeptide (TPR) repeat protein
MYCIVMGDIVNSRTLGAATRQRAARAAQAAFDSINTKYMGSLIADFGMVRGDAFEGVILTQSFAPQIVQDIIKAVYAVEKTIVRISVVLGELSVIDGDRNKTDGPAFHRALEKLSEIKKANSPHWLQVHFDVGSSLTQGLVDGQMALLAALTERWTDKQRKIVWEMESLGGSQKAVARKLEATPSVVTKQLKAAGYEAYRMAWDGLTEYLAKMDEYMAEGKPAPPQSYVPFFNIALRKASHHDFAGALKPAKKALALAKQGTGETQHVAIYNLLAEIYTNIKQYKNAARSISEALRIQAPMPKARLEYAKTLEAKAQLCLATRNFKDAKMYYNEALSTARNVVEAGHPYIGILRKLYQEATT